MPGPPLFPGWQVWAESRHSFQLLWAHAWGLVLGHPVPLGGTVLPSSSPGVSRNGLTPPWGLQVTDLVPRPGAPIESSGKARNRGGMKL